MAWKDVDGHSLKSACKIKSRRRRGLLCWSNTSFPVGLSGVVANGSAVDIAQIERHPLFGFWVDVAMVPCLFPFSLWKKCKRMFLPSSDQIKRSWIADQRLM